MGPVIGELRDRWATLMKVCCERMAPLTPQPFILKLVEKGVLTERDLDAKRLKTFRITARRMEIGRDRTSGLKWAMGTLGNIEKMCRAMGNLVSLDEPLQLTQQLEFSLGMFHTTAMEISGSPTAKGKAGNSRAGANGLKQNIEFQRLIMDVEGEMNDIRNHHRGKTLADAHPKMQKTLELVSC